MYGGKHHYLVNLGKIENTINSIDINFEIGNYSIDNIKMNITNNQKYLDKPFFSSIISSYTSLTPILNEKELSPVDIS